MICPPKSWGTKWFANKALVSHANGEGHKKLAAAKQAAAARIAAEQASSSNNPNSPLTNVNEDFLMMDGKSFLSF